MKKYNVGVIGATGMVGSMIIQVLKERSFPIKQLHLFASERSSGTEVMFNDETLLVETLNLENLKNAQLDIALMSAGGAISEQFAPALAAMNVLVIDNSSYWRMHDDVALVVPEVNGAFMQKGQIVANPNCSTIQSVLPLKALHDAYTLKRVVYTTYQAVSGSGVKGIRDLKENLSDNYPYPIRHNILPHIDDFLESGYTKEEMKMIEETRKILGLKDLKVTATTARVPLENTHAVSMNIELQKPFTLDGVRDVLANFEGIVLVDNPQDNKYPLAQDAQGSDMVFVGRLRVDDSVENGLHLWCVADNIRKGAASNTVQIALKAIEGWQ